MVPNSNGDLLTVPVAKESTQQQVKKYKACSAILSCSAYKSVKHRVFLWLCQHFSTKTLLFGNITNFPLHKQFEK